MGSLVDQNRESNATQVARLCKRNEEGKHCKIFYVGRLGGRRLGRRGRWGRKMEKNRPRNKGM